MANLKPQCASVQDIVTDRFRRMDRVRILEAGCGSNSAFKFEANAHIVGLDISEQQLLRNDALNEKHLGDIQAYSFPANSFDMIICWNVLEHLPHPEKALENFSQWLAPGGIMILALPNLLSATGLVTRFTPYWFHLFWYRHVCHVVDAGRHGRGPFPTYLRASLSLNRLTRYADDHRLRVLFAKAYGNKWSKGKGGHLRSVFCWLSLPIQLMSMNRISAFKEGIMLVLEKRHS